MTRLLLLYISTYTTRPSSCSWDAQLGACAAAPSLHASNYGLPEMSKEEHKCTFPHMHIHVCTNIHVFDLSSTSLFTKGLQLKLNSQNPRRLNLGNCLVTGRVIFCKLPHFHAYVVKLVPLKASPQRCR